MILANCFRQGICNNFVCSSFCLLIPFVCVCVCVCGGGGLINSMKLQKPLSYQNNLSMIIKRRCDFFLFFF